MIKNRFLRFLVTIVLGFVVIALAGTIDKSSGSPLAFAALFSSLTWGLFVFWRVLIGFPSNRLLGMIKNLFMVLLIGLAFIGLVVGIVFFYQQDASRLMGAVVVSALATYICAVISADEDDNWCVDYAPFVLPIIIAGSALGGFLLNFTRPYSAIAMIVFGAAFIGVTVFGFKTDRLSFDLPSGSYKSSSYSKPTTSSSSSSSSSQTYTPTVKDAMEFICKECSHLRWMPDSRSNFIPKITYKLEPGCVIFTVGGSARGAGIGRAAIEKYVQDDLKKVADDIEKHYQAALAVLRNHGVSTSSVAAAKVMKGEITYL